MTKRILFFLFISTYLSSASAQDLSGYSLSLEYNFANGVQERNMYAPNIDTINIKHDKKDGLYANGIYINSGNSNKSYMGIPNIDILAHQEFAVQLEFKADGMAWNPLICAGQSWRQLVVEFERDSLINLRIGSAYLRGNVSLKNDRWYTLTLIYDDRDSSCQFYIDTMFLGATSGKLNMRDFDTALSNTDNGRGMSFRGWWRALRIYTNATLPVLESRSIKKINLYPNPALNVRQVQVDIDEPFHYIIYNLHQEIQRGFTNDKIIELNRLKTGIYFINISTKKDDYYSQLILK